MKCLNSKIITLLICLQLALFPSVVFASGGLGGWTLSNPIAQGASTLYQGAKNVIINGKNVLKTSSALITPNATQVAKVLARGAGGYALSVAVAQLIGDGVDWVLDPDNNRVKYFVPDSGGDFLYYEEGTYNGKSYRFEGYTAEKVARQYYDFVCTSGWNSGYCQPKSFTCTVDYCSKIVGGDGNVRQFRPSKVNSNVKPEERYIPLPTVASKVISNAQNGDSSAKVATTAAAADVVNDAQNDDAKAKPIVNQLEQNATTQADDTTATGQTKPNTETGGMDLSLEFPAFCGWAPIVCEAAQSAINFPKTVEQWYNESVLAIKEAWNWFREEPTQPQKDPPLEIDQPQLQDPSNFDKTYINFGGQCPSVESTNISIGPISVPISIDISALCDFALKVRPAVLGLAYLTALGIISSAIREA